MAPLAFEPWLAETSAAEYDWHELFHPHFLDRKLWRLTYALESMERWIFAGDTWLLVPPLVVAALLLVGITDRTLALAVGGWLVASFFGISTVVFWIGRPDVGWYVGYAADRIMTTLPIVACYRGAAPAWSGDRAPRTGVALVRRLVGESALEAREAHLAVLRCHDPHRDAAGRTDRRPRSSGSGPSTFLICSGRVCPLRHRATSESAGFAKRRSR